MTKEQVEQAFKADLIALLERYKGTTSSASLEIVGNEHGRDKIIATIYSIWDEDGNELRPHVEVDLGNWFP